MVRLIGSTERDKQREAQPDSSTAHCVQQYSMNTNTPREPARTQPGSQLTLLLLPPAIVIPPLLLLLLTPIAELFVGIVGTVSVRRITIRRGMRRADLSIRRSFVVRSFVAIIALGRPSRRRCSSDDGRRRRRLLVGPMALIGRIGRLGEGRAFVLCGYFAWHFDGLLCITAGLLD